jgi:hypothetical protein
MLELARDCRSGVRGLTPQTLLPRRSFVIHAKDRARCVGQRRLFTIAVALHLHSLPVGLRPTSEISQLAWCDSTHWKLNKRAHNSVLKRSPQSGYMLRFDGRMPVALEHGDVHQS